MSDAIRSYRPPKGSNYAGPIRRGGVLRWLVPLGVLAGIVWLGWTTRDNCPVERVIPQDQSFHFQVRDLISTRREIARSPLWKTGIVPEQYAEIPEWIGNSFGYPDWVLNNLVSDVCYVSGTDLSTFNDLLVVTRMSRLGCLLERYHRFMDEIEDEYAGGLALRKLRGVDFYYAVRGRTLIFSPSRDAIIRALTLRDGDAIPSLETAGMDVSDDLQGRVIFSEDGPLGEFFEQSDCRLDLSATSVTFSSRSVMKGAWRTSLDELKLSQPAGPVSVPQQGGITVAGAFGAPLPDVWWTLDELTDGGVGDFLFRWDVLEQLSVPEREGLTAVMAGFFASMGTSFSLRTAGFDHNGMAPAPILELSVAPKITGMEEFLEAIPPRVPGSLARDGIPYYSAEDQRYHLPLGWGNVVEPVAYRDGPRLRVLLHPAHFAALEEAGSEMMPSPGPGHLFLRVRLSELLDSVRDGVMGYAECGMLRGHDPDSIAAMLAELDGIAARVPQAYMLFAYEQGELSVTIRLDLVVAE
jgi:hypothetical protein